MEKRTPHYSLLEIQVRVRELGGNAFTASALCGIEEMGLALSQALEVIAALERRAFLKSMTTYTDHKIWQDVYHGKWKEIGLYIKFQRAGDYFVISFKEL